MSTCEGKNVAKTKVEELVNCVALIIEILVALLFVFTYIHQLCEYRLGKCPQDKTLKKNNSQQKHTKSIIINNDKFAHT